MAHRRKELVPRPEHGSLELRASSQRGVWWEREDGLEVRLAAPERERRLQRSRLSLLGMLAGLVASGNVQRR
ncbi:MAG TPA: hypothetical protein VNG69_10370 [Casimicrobiaceae bacterium]|nr:hypothetical protein [Casimicrobiaceae bacterium]